MASAFSLAEDFDTLNSYYPYPHQEDYVPSYHTGLYNKGLVITAETPGQIRQMHFSLVPSFFKEPKSMMYNAKSAHLYKKPVFRQLMEAGKRCIVLADGFYQWGMFGPDRFPFRFVLKDRPVFAFAGLWSAWTDPKTTARYESFCLVTVPANPLVAEIRKSMPIILTKENEKIWLAPYAKAETLLTICTAYPETLMTRYRVSKDLADRSINDESLFKPLNFVKI